MVEPIDRRDFLDKIARNSGLVIVDALPRTAYERGHIPRAISIPSEEIIERAAGLLPDREAEIVVYCKNRPCRRSERAAERLDALGYRHVYDYLAGREDWTAAGLPLSRGGDA